MVECCALLNMSLKKISDKSSDNSYAMRENN